MRGDLVAKGAPPGRRVNLLPRPPGGAGPPRSGLDGRPHLSGMLGRPRGGRVVKVRIEAGALDQALRAVAAAVPRPGAGYAALQGVRLVADGAGVTFQASTLDLTITHAVPGEVAGAGSVLVPHAVLAAVAGRLRGAVELTGDSGVVLVRAGNRTAELRPLGDAVWPRFPPLAGDPIILSA